MLTESTRSLRWTLSACLCAALCVGCGSSTKPGDERAGNAQAATNGPVDPEPADAPTGAAAKSSEDPKIIRTAASGTALKVPDAEFVPEIGISSLDNDGTDVLVATPKTSATKQPSTADSKEDKPLDADAPELQAPPKQGTAEWFVYETTKLRLQPITQDEDTEKAKAARKARNEKIVEYAQKAVGLIHSDPQKGRLFQSAIRHLLDARLQLALAGEKDHIEAMYDDAAALAKRDPQSSVAAEAARALVELAYINASKSVQKDDTLWLQEFAVLATHFATQFPKEEPRAAPLLFTAAQSCENYGLTTEATNCYKAIVENYPNNKYASKASGILRRLKLPGHTVELVGPTLNGKQFDVASLRGKPVLVVFWATGAQPCLDQMPLIIATAKKFTPSRLAVVGINLDADPAPVSEFLISHKIGWPQICHAAEKTDDKDPPAVRWDHPIASQFGVSKIPSLWLLDRSGKVVSTSVVADDLEEVLTKLCDKTIPASATVEDAPRKKSTKTLRQEVAEVVRLLNADLAHLRRNENIAQLRIRPILNSLRLQLRPQVEVLRELRAQG